MNNGLKRCKNDHVDGNGTEPDNVRDEIMVHDVYLPDDGGGKTLKEYSHPFGAI